MPQLSAIVITRNEAGNIGECLDSLAFCDERIVVDCGSTDSTVDIAREKGARVEFHEWRGFGPQKSHALALATGTWVLSIDADERVTPELAAAIKAAIAAGDADAWEFPRLSSFCRRPMRHSGWYPDYVLRLFRRGKAGFDDAIVHERVICAGVVKRLRQPGDRREYFEAETDIWEVAARIAAGRKVREIDPAVEALRACVIDAADDPTISAVASKRLKEMLTFTELVDRWYTQMLTVPRSRLIALIRLGEKIVSLLPAGKSR